MEKVTLTGVPETLLWPLWNRAGESQRNNPILKDPLAEELVAKIDYAFEANFGKPSVWHPIRARVGDDLVRDYIRRTDNPVVVALGEGLDTGFWRVGSSDATWHAVDVPEAISLRQRLLPAEPRMVNHSVSALDPAWLDSIDSAATPFIAAAGLLMYFHESEVRDLLGRIASRWDRAEIFFDTIPPGFSQRSMRGMKVTKAYTAPPMPWGIRHGEIAAFLRSIPNIEPVQITTYADPFPHRTRIISVLARIPPLKQRLAPSLVHARTGKTA